MAWIRKRRRGDGGITYVVTWREPGATKESTISIPDDLEKAETNVRLLDANGQSFAAAERAVENAKIGGMTVRESMRKHVSLLTNIGPETLTRYTSAIRDHFGGNFGAIPVAAVRHEDIVAWIRYMEAKPSRKNPGGFLSSKTINNHHGLLSASMETAVRLRLRENNPCSAVSLPKDKSTEEKMYFMTAEESMAIVNEIADPYKEFLSCLRVTGARFNEATAFRDTDFKLNAEPPTVRVERAWKSDGKNGFYIGPPKTKKSRRSISLPPSFVEQVRPLVERAAKDGGWVFREEGGGPIRQSKLFNYWKRCLTRLGYPEVTGKRPRIHDFRHTHASIMLGGGFEIFKLSRRLGHESIQTTVDRYSHLTPDAQFEGAQIAEKAFMIDSIKAPLEILDAAS